MTDERLAEIRARHKEIDYIQTAGCNCFEQCWADMEALLADNDRLRAELSSKGSQGDYFED